MNISPGLAFILQHEAEINRKKAALKAAKADLVTSKLIIANSDQVSKLNNANLLSLLRSKTPLGKVNKNKTARTPKLFNNAYSSEREVKSAEHNRILKRPPFKRASTTLSEPPGDRLPSLLPITPKTVKITTRLIKSTEKPVHTDADHTSSPLSIPILSVSKNNSPASSTKVPKASSFLSNVKSLLNKSTKDTTKKTFPPAKIRISLSNAVPDTDTEDENSYETGDTEEEQTPPEENNKIEQINGKGIPGNIDKSVKSLTPPLIAPSKVPLSTDGNTKEDNALEPVKITEIEAPTKHALGIDVDEPMASNVSKELPIKENQELNSENDNKRKEEPSGQDEGNIAKEEVISKLAGTTTDDRSPKLVANTRITVGDEKDDNLVLLKKEKYLSVKADSKPMVSATIESANNEDNPPKSNATLEKGNLLPDVSLNEVEERLFLQTLTSSKIGGEERKTAVADLKFSNGEPSQTELPTIEYSKEKNVSEKQPEKYHDTKNLVDEAPVSVEVDNESDNGSADLFTDAVEHTEQNPATDTIVTQDNETTPVDIPIIANEKIETNIEDERTEGGIQNVEQKDTRAEPNEITFNDKSTIPFKRPEEPMKRKELFLNETDVTTIQDGKKDKPPTNVTDMPKSAENISQISTLTEKEEMRQKKDIYPVKEVGNETESSTKAVESIQGSPETKSSGVRISTLLNDKPKVDNSTKIAEAVDIEIDMATESESSESSKDSHTEESEEKKTTNIRELLDKEASSVTSSKQSNVTAIEKSGSIGAVGSIKVANTDLKEVPTVENKEKEVVSSLKRKNSDTLSSPKAKWAKVLSEDLPPSASQKSGLLRLFSNVYKTSLSGKGNDNSFESILTKLTHRPARVEAESNDTNSSEPIEKRRHLPRESTQKNSPDVFQSIYSSHQRHHLKGSVISFTPTEKEKMKFESFTPLGQNAKMEVIYISDSDDNNILDDAGPADIDEISDTGFDDIEILEYIKNSSPMKDGSLEEELTGNKVNQVVPEITDPETERRLYERKLAIGVLEKLDDKKVYSKRDMCDLIESGIPNHTPFDDDPKSSATNNICSVDNYQSSHIFFYQQVHKKDRVEYKSFDTTAKNDYRSQLLLTMPEKARTEQTNKDKILNATEPTSGSKMSSIEHSDGINHAEKRSRNNWRNEWTRTLGMARIYIYPGSPLGVTEEQKKSLDDTFAKINDLFQVKFRSIFCEDFEPKSTNIVLLKGDRENFQDDEQFKALSETVKRASLSRKIRIWPLEKVLRFIKNMDIDLSAWGISTVSERKETRQHFLEELYERRKTEVSEKPDNSQRLIIGPTSNSIKKDITKPDGYNPAVKDDSSDEPYFSEIINYLESLLHNASNMMTNKDNELSKANGIIKSLTGTVLENEMKLTSLSSSLHSKEAEIEAIKSSNEKYKEELKKREKKLKQMAGKIHKSSSKNRLNKKMSKSVKYLLKELAKKESLIEKLEKKHLKKKKNEKKYSPRKSAENTKSKHDNNTENVKSTKRKKKTKKSKS